MNNYLEFHKNIYIDDFLLINNFNIKIEQFNNTIIIGSSGCGKTTCLKNIKQFYKNNPRVKVIIVNDNTTKEELYNLLDLKIDYLFLDNLNNVFNDDELADFFSRLDKKNITYIYFTTDTNMMFLFQYCYLIAKSCIAMEGNPKSFFKEEKLFNKLGFEFPFYPRLSSNLILYDLIDEICYDEKSLEECLWNIK